MGVNREEDGVRVLSPVFLVRTLSGVLHRKWRRQWGSLAYWAASKQLILVARIQQLLV